MATALDQQRPRGRPEAVASGRLDINARRIKRRTQSGHVHQDPARAGRRTGGGLGGEKERRREYRRQQGGRPGWGHRAAGGCCSHGTRVPGQALPPRAGRPQDTPPSSAFPFTCSSPSSPPTSSLHLIPPFLVSPGLPVTLSSPAPSLPGFSRPPSMLFPWGPRAEDSRP